MTPDPSSSCSYSGSRTAPTGQCGSRTASGNGHAGKTLSTLEKTVSTLEFSIGTLEKTLSTFGKPTFMTMEKDMCSTKPFLSFV